MEAPPFDPERYEKLAKEAHKHNDIVIRPYLDGRSVARPVFWVHLIRHQCLHFCDKCYGLVCVQREGESHDSEDAWHAVVEQLASLMGRLCVQGTWSPMFLGVCLLKINICVLLLQGDTDTFINFERLVQVRLYL